MTDYESFLKQKDVSTNTIASYLADLEAFRTGIGALLAKSLTRALSVLLM